MVLVSLAFGLGIALLLNRKFLGRGTVRTMMIAPFLVVPVAAALLFKHGIYDPELRPAQRHDHLDHAPVRRPRRRSRTGSPTHPLLAVEAELIWQWTPFMTLILLAGLQSRARDVIEAARVDGAGPWQTFR